jgi:hypothetical protein
MGPNGRWVGLYMRLKVLEGKFERRVLRSAFEGKSRSFQKSLPVVDLRMTWLSTCQLATV